MQKPRIVITMGDPTGVGPEIIAATLALPEIADICRPLVLGDRGAMERAIAVTRARLEVRTVNAVPDGGESGPGVIPYADKFAYQERLNELTGAVGWTQAVSVHTSPMVPRDGGRATSAKLVVTCRLTIHALGTHSSTGEEWVADNNAATSAEAQAFKRACASFGLGAYLYYFFRGVWVDLGSDGQPLNLPALPDWATPDGWKQGARPSIERTRELSSAAPEGFDPQVVRDIEAMHDNLGSQIYRKMLKMLARVWEPKQIQDPQLARKVLADMKIVENRLMRAAHALETIGKPAFEETIQSFHLRSVRDFADLAVLEQIVAALEARADRTAEN